ncbi:receptor expression-enhancing protein 1 [Kryptolebias marmoratus]|uniref:Receptor expression-enhancing protein n=1 Tax=Kryptolebias marmoratus TaxID=37003 RepID=A0A3Q2ZUJ3_KRYMA|nr:receptor expression-enhancing protein 1 [Kryptolebias marmoratus]
MFHCAARNQHIQTHTSQPVRSRCLRNATLPSMDKSCVFIPHHVAACVRPDAAACHLEETPPRRQDASCRLSSAMVSWIISRLVVLVFGTLYPAYSSYKAVKTKDVKEYVKWMMYWIIFALFTTVEVFTDMFLCWLPFYYELKIAFVVWLLSPYTKGSSVLYRKFVHPTLSSKEKDIDEYICQAKDKSYDTLVHFGRKGLNVAATAAVMAATKGQGVLSDRLRSFSMQDLSSYQSDPVSSGPGMAQPTVAQHRTRPIIRSKSESYKDVDMAEYEVLGLEPLDSAEFLPQTTGSAPITPSVTPLSGSPSAPEQPEGELVREAQAASSSPQLRLSKRKAPEPPRRVLRPLTRSRSAFSSNTEAM